MHVTPSRPKSATYRPNDSYQKVRIHQWNLLSLIAGLRKQPKFRDVSNDCRNSILMTRHYQIWEVHFLTRSVNFDKCPCSYSNTNRRIPLHSLTINSLNSFQYTVYKEELWMSSFFSFFWYFQMLQSSWRMLWSNKQRGNLLGQSQIGDLRPIWMHWLR